MKTSPLRIIFFYNPNFILLLIQIKLFVFLLMLCCTLKLLCREYTSLLLTELLTICYFRLQFVRNFRRFVSDDGFSETSFYLPESNIRIFQCVHSVSSKYSRSIMVKKKSRSTGQHSYLVFGEFRVQIRVWNCFVLSSVRPDILE